MIQTSRVRTRPVLTGGCWRRPWGVSQSLGDHMQPHSPCPSGVLTGGPGWFDSFKAILRMQSWLDIAERDHCKLKYCSPPTEIASLHL